MEDRCVCCGEVIPEGRHICYTCEIKTYGGTAMSKLRNDDPVYYKVEINKLIKKAKQNGLEIGYEISSADNKIKNAKVLFMNDIGEIAAATVYDKSWEKLENDI